MITVLSHSGFQTFIKNVHQCIETKLISDENEIKNE
jgi:hypothetical protein